MNNEFDDIAGKIKEKARGNLWAVITVIILVAGAIITPLVVEDIEQNEILFVKAVGTGKVRIYKSAGWHPQYGGDVTRIKKSFQYWFSSKDDQGGKADGSIKARFNDNGHGQISGSIRIETPLDDERLMDLYTTYKEQSVIEHELIRTVLEKAVYMSGPLMSSTESASARRNQLFTYIEDQAQNGIYKTVSHDVKIKDAVTGQEKTATQVEPIVDPTAPNGIARHEGSPLTRFGFKSSNLSINDIEYDDDVKKQIATQQSSIMAVQVAIANAKKAEQDTLTAIENGKAAAAKAKWDQEVIKATEVTQAEKRRDIAQLDMTAAEFYKKKQILEGEGDAAKKRLVMEADGALAQKLEVYERTMGRGFQELGKQKWTPEIVMGGSGPGASGANNVMNMIDLLTTKTAKDLSLDMHMSGKK